MEKHTFSNWIISEVNSAKCALLAAYEHKDTMLLLQGPQLEKLYLEIFGELEDMVIKEEMECELLKEKKTMIQAMINRREPINMNLINQNIEERREELMKEAEGNPNLDEVGTLSGEGVSKIHELYNDIVKNFHPQVRTNLTAIQKELYQKAMEAYRRSDLDAMILIHDMIFSTEDTEAGMQLSGTVSEIEYKVDTSSVTTDFSLVSEIFGNFDTSFEEESGKKELEKYKNLTEKVMSEIEKLKEQFPFNTEELLKNPELQKEYQKELEIRLQTAKTTRENLEKEITKMTESVECVNG